MTVDMDCPTCQGEGYLLYLERGGVFSEAIAAHVAVEGYVACPVCDGEGRLELCADCLEPFQIRGGREVCVCDTVSLPQAA